MTIKGYGMYVVNCEHCPLKGRVCEEIRKKINCYKLCPITVAILEGVKLKEES